jgi:hypothetical protein
MGTKKLSLLVSQVDHISIGEWYGKVDLCPHFFVLSLRDCLFFIVFVSVLYLFNCFVVLFLVPDDLFVIPQLFPYKDEPALSSKRPRLLSLSSSHQEEQKQSIPNLAFCKTCSSHRILNWKKMFFFPFFSYSNVVILLRLKWSCLRHHPNVFTGWIMDNSFPCLLRLSLSLPNFPFFFVLTRVGAISRTLFGFGWLDWRNQPKAGVMRLLWKWDFIDIQHGATILYRYLV